MIVDNVDNVEIAAITGRNVVNNIVATASPADRQRLMRSATQMTDGADILAALRAAEDAERKRADREWQRREIARAAAAKAQAARAIQRRRAAVAATLDRLERLPSKGHVSALLRTVRGMTPHTPDAMRADLDAATDNTLTEIESMAAAIAARLDEVDPPPSECSRLGVRLARGDEDEIRDAAELLAEYVSHLLGPVTGTDWAAATANACMGFNDDNREARLEKARPLWDEFFNGAPPTLEARDEYEDYVIGEVTSDRWWRRRLRRESLRAQAWSDDALRMARPESPYCSRYTLGHYRQRRARDREIAAEMMVVRAGREVPTPLADVKKYIAQGTGMPRPLLKM